MALFNRRPQDDVEIEVAPTAPAEDEDIDRIRDVLRRAGSGDLEVRVTHVPPDSPYSSLAQDLNRLLDLMDAFLRETEATLGAAREGRGYRRFLLRGMLGAFAHGAQEVNGAADALASALQAATHADGPAERARGR